LDRNGKAVVLVLLFVGLLIGATLVAAGTQASARTDGETDGPASCLRIGVVDLSAVFKRSEQWADYQQERRQMLEKMQRSLERRQRQVEVLRNELRNLAPGTAAADKVRQDLQRAEQGLEREKQDSERRLAQHTNESLPVMIDGVVSCIQSYAQDNGINIVLKRVDLGSRSIPAVQQQMLIGTADVLYSDPKFDITDPIVDLLNSGYPNEIEEK